MKITGFNLSVAALIMSVSLLFPAKLHAQLSPGDLNRAHADLEGLKNCQKCHEAGNRISGARCLECHTILQSRIDAGRGLHAGEGYSQCTSCHVEHLGRDGELVWWKDGRENFDHRKTGYELTGKHLGLDCRKCHTEKNIVDSGILRSAEKDLNRTFLGLSAECTRCHVDEHRGQLGTDCTRCHTPVDWKSSSKFDHDKTKFKLTGRHAATKCEKCHRLETDNRSAEDPDFLKFAGLKFDRCLDCHQVYHKSGFDEDCTKCHTTAGWEKVDRSGFRHSDTRFPLKGKHLTVKCEKCHLPEKPYYGLQFSKCGNCHDDYHKGQFLAGNSKGECEACHNTDGFSPAGFSVEDHSKTVYPLEGSHLAVPCIACHKNAELQDGSTGMRFVFASRRCVDCHADPHKGKVDKYKRIGGCEYCHVVDAWSAVRFVHDSTSFRLEGKHGEIACRLCHGVGNLRNKPVDLKFDGIGSRCFDCHKDRHRGQFAVAESGKEPKTDCGSCHKPMDWKPVLFDHNRDAQFKLEGAHTKIQCSGCHKSVTIGEESYILYKPLDRACRSCHGEEAGRLGEAE